MCFLHNGYIGNVWLHWQRVLPLTDSQTFAYMRTNSLCTNFAKLLLQTLLKIRQERHDKKHSECIYTVAVTSSNPNRFSNFFYQWKEKENFNKTDVSFPTIP